MPGESEFEFGAFDYTTLTPTQRNSVLHQAIRRAHAERDAAIRDLVQGLRLSLGRNAARATAAARKAAGDIGCRAVSLWARYRAWRRRRIAAAELHALDDRELKDAGLRRCEIESVLHFGQGGDPTRLPRGSSAAFPSRPSRCQPAAAVIVTRNGCADWTPRTLAASEGRPRAA